MPVLPCLCQSTLASLPALHRLLPAMPFSVLNLSVFPNPAHSHCPCDLSSSLQPSLCSLGSSAVLLQILPSSQPALMPWAGLASIGLSFQEGDRTGPFLVLCDQQNQTQQPRKELRHSNSLLDKCLKHSTFPLYHCLGPVPPRTSFLDGNRLLLTRGSAEPDHCCLC